MKKTLACITEIKHYAPQRIITNYDIGLMINKNVQYLADGILEEKFGIKQRRFASREEQASDLAVNAAKQIVNSENAGSFDCLIFAAGSSDMIEPATACIIQHKLGLSCPALDVKNADRKSVV